MASPQLQTELNRPQVQPNSLQDSNLRCKQSIVITGLVLSILAASAPALVYHVGGIEIISGLNTIEMHLVLTLPLTLVSTSFLILSIYCCTRKPKQTSPLNDGSTTTDTQASDSSESLVVVTYEEICEKLETKTKLLGISLTQKEERFLHTLVEDETLLKDIQAGHSPDLLTKILFADFTKPDAKEELLISLIRKANERQNRYLDQLVDFFRTTIINDFDLESTPPPSEKDRFLAAVGFSCYLVALGRNVDEYQFTVGEQGQNLCGLLFHREHIGNETLKQFSPYIAVLVGANSVALHEVTEECFTNAIAKQAGLLERDLFRLQCILEAGFKLEDSEEIHGPHFGRISEIEDFETQARFIHTILSSVSAKEEGENKKIVTAYPKNRAKILTDVFIKGLALLKEEESTENVKTLLLGILQIQKTSAQLIVTFDSDRLVDSACANLDKEVLELVAQTTHLRNGLPRLERATKKSFLLAAAKAEDFSMFKYLLEKNCFVTGDLLVHLVENKMDSWIEALEKGGKQGRRALTQEALEKLSETAHFQSIIRSFANERDSKDLIAFVMSKPAEQRAQLFESIIQALPNKVFESTYGEAQCFLRELVDAGSLELLNLFLNSSKQGLSNQPELVFSAYEAAQAKGADGFVKALLNSYPKAFDRAFLERVIAKAHDPSMQEVTLEMIVRDIPLTSYQTPIGLIDHFLQNKIEYGTILYILQNLVEGEKSPFEISFERSHVEFFTFLVTKGLVSHENLKTLLGSNQEAWKSRENIRASLTSSLKRGSPNDWLGIALKNSPKENDWNLLALLKISLQKSTPSNSKTLWAALFQNQPPKLSELGGFLALDKNNHLGAQQSVLDTALRNEVVRATKNQEAFGAEEAEEFKRLIKLSSYQTIKKLREYFYDRSQYSCVNFIMRKLEGKPPLELVLKKLDGDFFLHLLRSQRFSTQELMTLVKSDARQTKEWLQTALKEMSKNEGADLSALFKEAVKIASTKQGTKAVKERLFIIWQELIRNKGATVADFDLLLKGGHKNCLEWALKQDLYKLLKGDQLANLFKYLTDAPLSHEKGQYAQLLIANSLAVNTEIQKRSLAFRRGVQEALDFLIKRTNRSLTEEEVKEATRYQHSIDKVFSSLPKTFFEQEIFDERSLIGSILAKEKMALAIFTSMVPSSLFLPSLGVLEGCSLQQKQSLILQLCIAAKRNEENTLASVQLLLDEVDLLNSQTLEAVHQSDSPKLANLFFEACLKQHRVAAKLDQDALANIVCTLCIDEEFEVALLGINVALKGKKLGFRILNSLLEIKKIEQRNKLVLAAIKGGAFRSWKKEDLLKIFALLPKIEQPLKLIPLFAEGHRISKELWVEVLQEHILNIGEETEVQKEMQKAWISNLKDWVFTESHFTIEEEKLDLLSFVISESATPTQLQDFLEAETKSRYLVQESKEEVSLNSSSSRCTVLAPRLVKQLSSAMVRGSEFVKTLLNHKPIRETAQKTLAHMLTTSKEHAEGCPTIGDFIDNEKNRKRYTALLVTLVKAFKISGAPWAENFEDFFQEFGLTKESRSFMRILRMILRKDNVMKAKAKKN